MNESPTDPPDADLIAAMGGKDDDLDAAKAAFVTFFNRHRDYMLRHLRGAKQRLVGCSFDVEDVVQELFAFVWRRGHESFNPGRRSAGVSEEASTRAWLTQVGKTVVTNTRRKPHRHEPMGPIENEDLFAEPQRRDVVRNAVAIQQFVDQALNDLDAKIVRFKLQYYDPDTGNSQPPSNELDSFLAENNLSTDAFRKRYSRAIALLRAAETLPLLTTH